MRSFTFDDFIKKINSGTKGHQYKVRVFTPTEELFDLCKKMSAIIPYNNKITELWIKIAYFIERCPICQLQPREINVDTFEDLTTRTMFVRQMLEQMLSKDVNV
jgi:hypothetical protein